MTNSHKIRRLYGLPDNENFGFSEVELLEAEKRLGVKLPVRLRKYYMTLGKNENINYAYNRLLEPDKEIQFSDDRYLIFYEENQMVVYWGIKEEDLKLDNPEVWGNYGTEESPDWHKETNSTDDFFLLMAIYNGTFGGLKFNANSFEKLAIDIMRFIEINWKEVLEISREEQKVYTNNFEEVIIVSYNEEKNPGGIFIGTNHREKFDALLSQLKIDWSYTSYDDEECDEGM